MNDRSSAHAWKKSDFVLFTWTFGLITLLLGVFSLDHVRQGQLSEAAVLAAAMLLPLTIALWFRRMLRHGIWERRNEQPSQGLIDLDRKTWENSILNPDHPFNQDRIKHPPDIG
ncbi:MAG: hypothetical protein QY323_01045 [Patescibacteria group bacterium]|nr:MAG: hypothetical protein QY323_01045 [Patescibacteria group bacterium]